MEKILINIDTVKPLVTSLKIADTFWTRFWGLIPKKSLPEGEGLMLSPCNSVHTLFMKFSIDIIILDRYYCVLKVYERVKPWRFIAPCKKGSNVLELPSGTVLATQTLVGHRVAFVKK